TTGTPGSLTVGGDLSIKSSGTAYGGNGGDSDQVLLNGGSVSVGGNLTIDSGVKANGSTQIGSVEVGGGSLSVTGNVAVTSVTNSGNIANSTLDMSSGGTLNVGGSFTVNGTFTRGTGTVNFNGSTAGQTIAVSSINFNNLNINNTHA